MCGRFTLRARAGVLAEQFACEIPPLEPRYNVAPTQMVAAVRQDPESRQRQFLTLRWGLIPSWAKDASIGSRMINARAETIADKPAFRAAFRRRRCLVLADGYYEWTKRGGTKQPYYFRRRDEQPFALAGVWETWRDKSTEQEIQSCTVITTEANELSRPIHDRMPVILSPRNYRDWIDSSGEEVHPIQELLRPCDSGEMRVDPVSTFVNSPRNDSPKCVQVLSELF
jgi:putative SOS response-associated peptidase YedK